MEVQTMKDDLKSTRDRLMRGASKWVPSIFDSPTPLLPVNPPKKEKPVAYTHFEPCTIKVGDFPKRAAKAKCGRCSNTDTLPINTARSHGNDDDVVEKMVSDKFEKIGWLIGRTPAQDRCPSCFAAIRASRKRKDAMKNSTSEPATVEVSNKIVQMPQLNVPPQETKRPTRDERRIIYEKLRDVYVNETVGYMAGWSDKKVGDDLGVPWAWVSAQREEHFGPDIDEAKVSLINEAKAVLIEMNAARISANPIVALLHEVNKRAEAIEQHLRELTSAN
jgi:hypothetical protein